MPVRVKITPFANSVKILVDSRLSPQARSQRVAAFASDRIAKADEINRRALGTVPPKTVTVDGREGAALASVNPDHGVIIAEWQFTRDVLEWIRITLMDRSPVGPSGRYRNYHFLYADNVEVAQGEDPPKAEEYIFLNPLPYTRKIEIGKTESGRDFVISVPNRIYERTANDAQARFGNVAKIRFIYSSLGDVGATPIGEWARSGTAFTLSRRAGRRTKSIAWLTRVPAIQVTFR